MSVKEKHMEVQEKLDDITECPICTGTYKEPKILPCIHTFCMTCLQETGLKTEKSAGDKMPCPICRTEFTVPDIGFVGLQRNFFMERLIDTKNILNPSSTRALCDACEEDNDLGAEAEIPLAEMYCVECSQRLCEDCCKNHKKYKATKTHKMLSLDDVQNSIPSNDKSYVCDDHDRRPLEIYCSTCHDVVCALCPYKSHKTHDTSPVIDAIIEFRKIIGETSDSMKTFILDLKDKQKHQYNGKAAFYKQVGDIENEIKSMRQSLQEHIERDCDSILQHLNFIRQKRIKDNESQVSDFEMVLSSMESWEAYSLRVTAIGSDIDICRAVHDLSARAAELKLLYKSISLEPFPEISIKKTAIHDASGNNIFGEIEENGNDETSQTENIISVRDQISSLMNECFEILDKASVEEKAAAHNLKIEIPDQLQMFSEAAKDENKFAEMMETSVCEEIKVSTTCDEILSDRLKQLKIKINRIVEANAELRNELKVNKERSWQLEEKTTSMYCEAEAMKFNQMRSDQEIIDLKNQVTLLSEIAYNGDTTTKIKKALQYKGGLTFLQAIRPANVNVYDEKSYRVTGLAILDNELFIASASNVVEINDLRTMKFKRLWRVGGMGTVLDIKASVRNKCIYLLCRNETNRSSYDTHLLRFNAGGKVVRQWKLDAGAIYSEISVTDTSNVLLTANSKLIEYSPDGEPLLVIYLKWESGIQHPAHAIKLTSDHFLLCHGTDPDLLHRVCILDINGNVLKYFGEVGKRDKLNSPMYLEMTSDGNIFVADHSNQRLLLLNSSLELMQEFKPRNPGDHGAIETRPRKMILDEINGRMIVAEKIWKVPRTGERCGNRLSVYTW